MSDINLIKESGHIIEEFGNHTKRYRVQIKKLLTPFLNELDKRKLSREEYFFNLWFETEYQLMLLEQLGSNEETKQKLFQLYFAFHYLKMNVESVNYLTENISEGFENPFNNYRAVLIKIRQDFFTLCRGIMNRLSYYSYPKQNFSRYVFFNVGSLVDHEDLDVGIVHEGDQTDPEFNSYIGRLSQRFFKTVTHLHFYLAESLNVNHYSGSISTYIQYLNENKDDIVFVSQLLGATRLTGNMELFYEFKASLVERYFRGITGYRSNYIEHATTEIEKMCSVKLSETIIHPKAECYRIFTILASALRIAWQIHRGNIWETFDQFIRVDPQNRIFYVLLEDAYAFVQILRYLFNLYVSQKDTIAFNDDIEGEWLDKIAGIMGMKDRYSLHDDYHYIAGRGRDAALYLARHLRKQFLNK